MGKVKDNYSYENDYLGAERAMQIFNEIQEQRMFPEKDTAPTPSQWKRYIKSYEENKLGSMPLDWAMRAVDMRAG